MPQWMANLIDNPFRRIIQQTIDTAVRHGITPGMRVLEVGPGNGTYTIASAKQVGPSGQIVAIDIEPKMIDRLEKKIIENGITNIKARVADIYDLPFEASSFDLAYMIAVINEIPDIPAALVEFHRVLKTGGKLVFSELLLDPDYPLSRSLINLVQANNFSLKDKIGNFFYYTLIFEKTS
jgi:ubiquinone/menaquinone biosynthesis C-methylase UbiE